MTTATTTTTAAVANELVSLARAGKNFEAIDRLYSPDIVSVEPVGNEMMPAVMNGIEAIRGKNQWWFDNNETHEVRADGPFVGEDQFAVRYEFETTFKPTGVRSRFTEMALYTVKDGKIVREEFYYHLPSEEK
ncbi:MAG: SnoaL-like domain-containing protein [Gemmatimonadales bacterium]